MTIALIQLELLPKQIWELYFNQDNIPFLINLKTHNILGFINIRENEYELSYNKNFISIIFDINTFYAKLYYIDYNTNDHIILKRDISKSYKEQDLMPL